MYQSNVDQISIKTVLDTSTTKKNGLYPIRVRVIKNRKIKYYNTGQELSKDDWEKLPSTRDPKLVRVRNIIKSSYELILKNIEELSAKGQFSYDLLKIRLGRTSGDTINNMFKVRIEYLRKEGQIGTMQSYEVALKSIEKFAGDNIRFIDINIDWLNKYEKHLVAINHRYATIGIRMRTLRAIMNIAKKNGLINEAQYPFGRDKYEIKTGESVKKALTLEQISQIINYTDGKEITEFYRDIWFFIYMCNGINAADLVKRTFKDIKDGELCFVREKTKRTTKHIKEIRVPITNEMQMIIDRWGNNPNPNNYIFPLINNSDDPVVQKKEVHEFVKKINIRTNKIGKELGIGNVTTYTARHSFATVLKRSGSNIAFISESLGHASLATTQSYLASFEKDEREKNAAFLTNFKQSPEKSEK